MAEVQKLIVTTSWDDGYYRDKELALLLTSYGVKGTFYVGKSIPDSLTREELLELDKEHEIGAHTLNHVDLSNIPIIQVKKEINGSKEYLQDLLGREVTSFCYPYGRYNQEIKRIVQEAGFLFSRTCDYGHSIDLQDLFAWKITLHASNGSPRITLKTCWDRCLSFKALFDWEIRAKLLFDLALQKGGVYHLWGHSIEFEQKDEWDKLERVLVYIANKEQVRYLTNSEAIVVMGS